MAVLLSHGTEDRMVPYCTGAAVIFGRLKMGVQLNQRLSERTAVPNMIIATKTIPWSGAKQTSVTAAPPAKDLAFLLSLLSQSTHRNGALFC